MIIKGKEWLVQKIYPNFYLCINQYGVRECFSKIEVEGIPKIIIEKQQKLYDGVRYDI